MTVTLRDLLHGISSDPIAPVPVTGIARHSKQVRPGDLFVAIRGSAADGHAFIEEAISRGASAVIAERRPASLQQGPSTAPCPCVVVRDSRAALAEMAARFYGYPSRKLRVIGVTGTTGKTTTTYVLRAMLQAHGQSVGLLGTVVYQIGGRSVPSSNTTPGPLELQRYFAQMAGEGLGWCVMEVSSHALAQGRVSGLDFEAGIFTNLGSDHLDYHQTQEAYAAAKRRLFDESVRLGGHALVNIDDPFGRVLAETIPNRTVTTYGVEHPGRVSARHVACTWQGLSFVLASPWGTLPMATPLLGRHNVPNILAAAAALLALGVPPDAIRQGVAALDGVPGRLERVPSDGGPTVLIDYAHSPEALRQVLLSVREMCRGRILVVFGCGGDRDQTKRPTMGQLASLLADYVVLTSDNPRSEDPHLILRQIRRGFVPTFDQFQAIPDREQAIVTALSLARGDDAVVIAGKGHEAHQTFARVSVPFVDRDVVSRWLSQRQTVAVS